MWRQRISQDTHRVLDTRLLNQIIVQEPYMPILTSQYVSSAVEPDDHVLLSFLVVFQPIRFRVIWGFYGALLQVLLYANHLVRRLRKGMYELGFVDADGEHEVVDYCVEEFADVWFVILFV